MSDSKDTVVCRMRLVVALALVAAASLGWPGEGAVPSAWGACAMEREHPDQTGWFIRHLDSDCSMADREAQAVQADDVLAALTAGKGVALDGVVVAGDLLFDAMPAVPAGTVADPPPVFQELIQAGQIRTMRRLAGPLTIANSTVRGAFGSRAASDYLIIQGPVTASGTTFERLVDFSRTVFMGPAEFSGSTFQAQAFFIEARFAQAARFEQVVFGPHTRFHKAVFAGPGTFHAAAFNGLAEFLEVMFLSDANFSKAAFSMGTGFSGSRFKGRLDASGAVFEREAFFTFTEFEQDAVFRGAAFKGTTDFSDAHFKGMDDFSRAVFTVEPRFTRVQTSGARSSPGLSSDPRVLYGLAGILLVATLLLAWRMRQQ